MNIKRIIISWYFSVILIIVHNVPIQAMMLRAMAANPKIFYKKNIPLKISNQKPLSPWQKWARLIANTFKFTPNDNPSIKIKNSAKTLSSQAPLVAFSSSANVLKKRIEEKRIEEKRIENEIEKIIQNDFTNKIDNVINKKILDQEQINTSIKNIEEEIHKAISKLKENKNNERLIEDIYQNYIRKKYNQNYFKNYIDTRLENLKKSNSELASQQPLIIEHQKKEEIQFYTEIFKILEEIKTEPVEIEPIKFENNNQKMAYIQSRINIHDLTRFIDQWMPGSKIANEIRESKKRTVNNNNNNNNIKDTEIDEQKQKAVENIYNASLLINQIFARQNHPNNFPNWGKEIKPLVNKHSKTNPIVKNLSDSKSFDAISDTENSNISGPYDLINVIVEAMEQKINVKQEIENAEEKKTIEVINPVEMKKIIDPTIAQNEENNDIKDEFVDSSLKHISKDILKKEIIEAIINDVFIPLTAYINNTWVKQELRKANINTQINKENLINYFEIISKKLSESSKKLLNTLFQEYIIKLLEEQTTFEANNKTRTIDKHNLERIAEKALETFKEKVMHAILSENPKKRKLDVMRNN